MVALIIGHTTADSAKIWVRGGPRRPKARITLRDETTGQVTRTEVVTLSSSRDYTAVARVPGLAANTGYEVEARFPASRCQLGAKDESCSGHLRTFPAPEEDAPFSFLLGACNLPTARLTALREQLVSGLGTAAVTSSLKRETQDWYWPRLRLLRSLMSRLGPLLGKAVFKSVQKATRFELLEPDVGHPFGRLLVQLEGDLRQPAFMIHGGDQIYFDIDVPPRPAIAEEYRRAYRQAWFDDEEAQKFLASCPQYMIPDNHDVSDNEPSPRDGRKNRRRYAAALEAYADYVHSRHPDGKPGAMYYDFRHGRTSFFFLDTRIERSVADGRMIGEEQLDDLLAWLGTDPGELKFLVTSVPFVGQVRGAYEPHDKWCGRPFRRQRDAIIDTIHGKRIERLVFLAGDMHATYHATLRIGPPGSRVVVHELAGGPINQIEFGQRRKFHDYYRGRTEAGLPFASVMHAFTGASASVTRVDVDPSGSPSLSWQAIRLSPAPKGDRYEPRPLSGRVSLG
jgi:phosphodiesterase/alkaline phosphatase D-like protein